MERFEWILETPSYGRSVSDDDWENLEPAHIEIWKSAIELLSKRTLQLSESVISIEIDWRPILRKHERHYRIMRHLHSAVRTKRDPSLILKTFPKHKARVKFIAKITGLDQKSQSSAPHLAESAIKSFIFDFFLILNISAPGSCDFYRSTLLRNGQRDDLSLSNVHFELAQLGSIEEKWLQIHVLPLPRTVKWFDAVRSGSHQLPENPMEKALFALLHISKLDMDPMITIWLFYAFESLLQTRTGENFSTLTARLVALLELDDVQGRGLRKRLRALYDIRSAIVHGGLEITHPLQADNLDERVDESLARASEATNFGLTVLISAIQKTIVRGWKYPSFSERIHGVTVD